MTENLMEEVYHFQTDKIDRYFHRDPEDAEKYLKMSEEMKQL